MSAPRHRRSLPFVVLAVIVRLLPAIAGDCPLDFSWSNFTSTADACSNQNERAKCCRYINAIIAVSVAHYANTSKTLGIPSLITDVCTNSVSSTLQLHGVPSNALMFCGLGQKIRVSYQCQQRETILDMLQSPNFTDVVRNCQLPLSSESSCRRCLISDIIYLHHLIGVQDNVTLNTCRDAAFVALANQGSNLTALDLAACFFSAEGISILSVNASEPSSQMLYPTASPSPPPALGPSQRLVGVSVKKHHHSYQLSFILGVGIMVTSVAILLLLVFVLLIWKKSKELDADILRDSLWSTCPPPPDWKCQEGPSSNFRRFSYKETKIITKNFSNSIRRGGSGTVYKAQFDDGFMASVTRMQSVTEQGEEEFSRTMELLGRLHHRCLVALRGYCNERHERFLIYDYMENGSVHDHLHSIEGTPLAWETRIQVAFDVANALEYLHFYCDPPFIHGDIKSSNILLDGSFLAKVCNFGLAHASRSSSLSFEKVNIDIRGTPGYMDPEYTMTRELNEKSDVYSFGVLLLELVTGRRAVHENQNLVEWFQIFMENDSRLPEMVDPAISYSFNLEHLRVMVLIIQCTLREASTRPTIKQVLRMLCERLNPVHNGFARAIRVEEDDYGERRARKGDTQQSELFSYNSDTGCLQSSSSTSRSYCSRSILFDNSPRSPERVLSFGKAESLLNPSVCKSGTQF